MFHPISKHYWKIGWNTFECLIIIYYSGTNTTGATQHGSANYRSCSQQRSLALVVCKPIKNKNISLNFKVLGFFGGPG